MINEEQKAQAIAREIKLYHDLSGSDAFKQLMRMAKTARTLALSGMNGDSSVASSKDVLKQQGAFWNEFSGLHARIQDQYIGLPLARMENAHGKNRADHSREVAKATAQGMKAIAKKASVSMSSEDIQLIYARGILHDAGFILNLDDSILERNITIELNDKTVEENPLQIAYEAAVKLHQKYGKKIGPSEPSDIAAAISFTAISDREGPLFREAVKIDPSVKNLRAHFKGNVICSSPELQGLYNYAAHHDLPGNMRISGYDRHSAVDHFSMSVDRWSGATGDSLSLDESVLCLLSYANEGQCDPGYVRVLLENYGTGNSILENSMKRIPYGVTHADKKDLIKALKNPSNNQLFPQLLSSWSPYGADSDEAHDLRTSLSDRLRSHSSVADFICAAVEKDLPALSVDRIREDMKVTHIDAFPEQKLS